MVKPVTLYDPIGRKITVRAANPAWDATGTGRRALTWSPTRESVNSLTASYLDDLRAKTRDVVRRNSWAGAAVDSFVANVVGAGITPRLNIADKALRELVSEEWKEWVDVADADGNCDFYGLQALAVRGMREGGEVFTRFRERRDSDGLSVPLQLQMVEGELCDHSINRIEGNRIIRAGVEFNPIGQRSNYWMFPAHPGESLTTKNGAMIARPIPASQFVHTFQVLRPGQVRGLPGLASVVAKLYELDKYDGSEVARKTVAAMFAGFITTQLAEDGDPLGGGALGEDDDDIPLAPLEPGTMQRLLPGENIEFSEPADVGAAYEAFLRVQLRAIAKASNITYEQLTGDLTNVNFSSIRAGLIEARRIFEQIQRHVVVFKFCRTIWRRWIETAILSGAIPMPRDRKVMRALLRPVWVPPGWEYVDPEKEVNAVRKALAAHLISWTQAVSRYGFDPEDLAAEIEADNERAERMGLVKAADAEGKSGGMRDGDGDGDSGEGEDGGKEGNGGRRAAG